MLYFSYSILFDFSQPGQHFRFGGKAPNAHQFPIDDQTWQGKNRRVLLDLLDGFDVLKDKLNLR